MLIALWILLFVVLVVVVLALTVKEVGTFVYTEIGTILTLFKYQTGTPPVWKYSLKRIGAIGLVVVAASLIGIPKDVYQVISFGLCIVAAAFLIWYAAKTKT